MKPTGFVNVYGNVCKKKYPTLFGIYSFPPKIYQKSEKKCVFYSQLSCGQHTTK